MTSETSEDQPISTENESTMDDAEEIATEASDSEKGVEGAKKSVASQATTDEGDAGDASSLLKADDGPAREVSATTITRMLGIPTSAELKLLEGKLDLITSKVNSVVFKVEKLTGQLGGLPSGADLERIEVQIGALRTMIRDALTAEVKSSPKEAASQETKAADKIVTN